MRFVVRYLIVLFVASLALASCTLLQKRSPRSFSGVVLNEATERPVEGVLIVLYETRVPFIHPFPFATEGWHPIAHTTSAADGSFSFQVCMTEGSYLLDWDDRGASRNPVWEDIDSRTIRVRLFVRALVESRREKRDFDYWLKLEDSSLTRSCL
jgi:hypothetical protein